MATGTGTTAESELTKAYWKFLPNQWRATNAINYYDYILYGGTRGCAKSHWLRRVISKLLIDWHQEYGLTKMNAMLACETYTALQDRQIIPLDDELPEWLGVMKSTQKMGLHVQLHEKWGSSRILLRNLEDPSKYKSGQYAIIAIDQLEQIPEKHFWLVNGSLRHPGLPRAKFLSTGNPLGIGHQWNVDYFIDHRYPSHVEPDIQAQFKFIAGSPYDNPYLEPSYWRFLNSLEGNLRRAWLEGDYHTFMGQAFPTFTYETHVVQWDDKIIEGWKQWPKWRAVDWGFSDPYVCGWFAKDPSNGRIVLYRDSWRKSLTDREQANDIKTNTPQEEHCSITYADPSMWTKKNRAGYTAPTSAADVYAREGVPLTSADNNRLNGMRKFRYLLGDLPDGRPGFLMLETCYNTWRSIPQLITEEFGEDVEHGKRKKQNDHGYDMIRYGITNELGAPAPEKKSKPTPSPLEEMMGV